MKSLVSIRTCRDYEPPLIADAVEKLLENLGGLRAWVKRGDRVLLKPNLLRAASPEKAIVTHPALVEAVASKVLDCGAKPFIGDSPGLGSLRRVLSRSGYDPFMKKLGVQPVPFTHTKTVEFSAGRTFRRIDLAAEVFEFDSVINLAKLKTHEQMLLTLSVKNLFGTVVGAEKPMWHLRAGNRYDSFATVLVQIYDAIRPALSIVDGILGMEGDGPNSGVPRDIGIIAGSQDAVALDAVLCTLVGLPSERLRTSVMAHTLGIGTADPDTIQTIGDTLEGFPLKDFQRPESMSITWNLSESSRIRRFLENHAVPRPEIDHSVCEGCQICLTHCPPQAITERRGKMIIDRSKCISCFCCHELCGGSAIDIERPILGRILARITR